MTEKRFSTFERFLAGAGLLIATVGVVATCIQAWAALEALPRQPAELVVTLGDVQ